MRVNRTGGTSLSPSDLNRVLVLSGGAGKGIFEVACLKVLLERYPEWDFDGFVGISAGALNVAYLAQTPMGSSDESRRALREKVDALLALWFSVGSYRGVYKGSLACKLPVAWRVFVKGEPSAVDASPIRAMIDEHIRADSIADSGRKVVVGTTDLDTGEYVEFTEQDPEIVQAVKASAAIPSFFSPVEIGPRRLVDGALRNNTPLSTAYRLEPREIIAIQTTPIRVKDEETAELEIVIGRTNRGETKDALDILARAAMIMSEEVQKDDVQGAYRWARALKASGRPLDKLPRAAIPTRIWAPREILLGDEKLFSQCDLDRMAKHGEDVGGGEPILEF